MKLACGLTLPRIFPTVSLLFLFAAMPPLLSAGTKFSPLFNGKNLDGWQHVGPGSFVVENGLLKTQGGMGLLWYTRCKIKNAIIRVVFKMTGKDSDSGVFIRILEKPAEPWMPVNRGYEVEIGNWPGAYSSTGALYSFTKASTLPIRPIGQWNTMDIIIGGPRTIVYLNRIKVTDFREGQPVPPRMHSWDPDRGPRPDSGYIGLQNEPGQPVYFKDISVRPLGVSRQNSLTTVNKQILEKDKQKNKGRNR